MFFIYPGIAIAMGGQGETFLSMIRHAGLSKRNLALVADPYGENYDRGISPAISDLPAVIGWHRDLLQEHPHVTEWYHIGHSSGGYGALLFGHLLGAKKVWAFAPRTAKLGTADAAKASLKELLSAGDGTTEHFICYSPENRRDVAFAEYFAGCPGVALVPYAVPPPADAASASASSIENHYHGAILRSVINNGDLRTFMPPFRAAGDAGEAASAA